MLYGYVAAVNIKDVRETFGCL